MAYIDTSVLVAYYCPERLSLKAERIVRAAEGPAISPLVEVEFCSALAIKTRTGGLAKDDARKVLSVFLAHLLEGRYRSVPIDAREYLLARDWIGAFSTPLRTVDALHLAAAFSNDLTLVTADKALAACAKALGVKHRLVA
jgi:hypothetical protein